MEETTSAEALAAAHWDYIEGVIRCHGEDEEVIRKCEHHYKTAWVHADKHARADRAEMGFCEECKKQARVAKRGERVLICVECGAVALPF